MKRVLLALALVLVSVQSSRAASITLQWDKNPEPDIAGYEISYGTSVDQYPNIIDVGNVTEYQVTGLIDGVRYFFVAQAYYERTPGNHIMSGYSTPVNAIAAQQDPPECAPIVGREAISLFITAIGYTTQRPNSKAFVDFQAASRTPIQSVIVALDPMPPKIVGPAPTLTDMHGVWFLLPAVPGTYNLILTVTNAFGCVFTSSPRAVRVNESGA